MGEWALPPDEGAAFEAVLHRAQEEHLPEARWLRGALLAQLPGQVPRDQRPPQADAAESDRSRRCREGPARDDALTTSIRASRTTATGMACSAGIYISHMRLATWAHLIAAEDLAEGVRGYRVSSERRDTDMDGTRRSPPRRRRTGRGGRSRRGRRDRFVGHPPGPARAGRGHAASTGDLPREATARRPKTDGGHVSAGDESDAPVSIHDIVRTKEPGLADLLVYDAYERRSGLIRALPSATTAEAWAAAQATDLGDLVDGPFEIEVLETGRLIARRATTIAGAQVHATKTIEIGGDRGAPTLTLTVDLEHGRRSGDRRPASASSGR